MTEPRTSLRTCPFCEATCGLEVVTRGDDEVVSVRGDVDDVFSHGYICPKATGLKHLHDDPDRLRRPLLRRGGELVEVSWDEAFDEVDRRLGAVLAEHGPQAVAVYLGNPNAHNLSAALYNVVLLKALGTRQLYTAGTVDQMPKQVSAGLMFGNFLSIPVPDVDRTDHLLMLGANPLVSNGSLMTAPDMRGRLRRLRERGGKLVVVDPVRTRTAQAADEHHFIRPGTDALLLMAIVHVLLAEELARPGRLAPMCNGLEEIGGLAEAFSPDAVAPVCGIAAEQIRRMARELATAPRAVAYARIGGSTQEFGTLTNWLVDVINVLTGNLDREGGAMFPLAVAGQRNAQGAGGSGKGFRTGRWHSRVRGLPEVCGELPVACLAEEIETPGEGQVRALITIAGNPALSTPDAGRLVRALSGLDFMICLDIYVNETSRHADVVLPVPDPLARSHFDLIFGQFSVRSTGNYSPPVLARPEGMPDEWQTVLRLAAVVTGRLAAEATGQGAGTDIQALDEFAARTLIGLELSASGSPLAGQNPDELLAALEPRRGPERLLDFLIRSGPFGDLFGARPDGLTLAAFEASPHGIDLGPLRPRLPHVLRTPSGRIEVTPPQIVADVSRLRAVLDRVDHAGNGTLMLIGRRQLRSNNSWMHNLAPLVKGRDQCTMQINPADAERLRLTGGARASVTSSAGTIEVPVEVTDEIMAGVVSIPHGWGHDTGGARLAVAAEHPGTNSNVLADSSLLDPLSGNTILNGIPVKVTPAP